MSTLASRLREAGRRLAPSDPEAAALLQRAADVVDQEAWLDDEPGATEEADQ